MTESQGVGLSAATRARLEQELAEVREQRNRVAGQVGGEDPADPDPGDEADGAVQLEELDDLSRINRRIAEIEKQLAAEPDATSGLDGTRVTLRFPDGQEATYLIVAIPEEAPADEQDDVVTADSPLGQALVGRSAGDTVTYEGPDGELQAEVVSLG